MTLVPPWSMSDDNSQRCQNSVCPLAPKVLGGPRQVRAPEEDWAAQAEARRHQGPRAQRTHLFAFISRSLLEVFQWFLNSSPVSIQMLYFYTR